MRDKMRVSGRDTFVSKVNVSLILNGSSSLVNADVSMIKSLCVPTCPVILSQSVGRPDTVKKICVPKILNVKPHVTPIFLTERERDSERVPTCPNVSGTRSPALCPVSLSRREGHDRHGDPRATHRPVKGR